MLIKSHIVLYLCFLILISAVFNTKQLILAALIGVFMSAVPDLDEKNSSISRKYPVLSFITRFFAKEHHGMTHSPLFLFAVSAVISILLSLIAESLRFWIFATYAPMLMHLLADFITSRIPLLYPFSNKKFGFSLFKTGSLYEKVIIFILLVFTVLVKVRTWF